MRDVRRTSRHTNRASQLVGSFGDLLRQQYGFLADPTLPVWKNVERRYREMKLEEFEEGRLRNMACHNLLRTHPLPAGTTKLLGLGLNYCIKPPSTTSTTTNTFNRMKGDVRRIYHLQDVEANGEYVPALYIKSDYEFEDAEESIEIAMRSFESAVKQEQLAWSRRRKPSRNLKFGKWKMLNSFKSSTNYIVVQADKNLGPCILDRRYYVYRACKEHLANQRNYRQLTKERAKVLHLGLKYQFEAWLFKFRPRTEQETPPRWTCIGEAEYTFLTRAYKKYPDKLARFRMTAKVHKTPYKFRPIVCCAGTFMNAWSKWLDYWLQKLKSLVPTFVKDSQQVLDETKNLHLPPNAKLFTTDANAMYSNIDTTHAIEVISTWLHDLHRRRELPEGFPLDAILSAMTMIMKNNLFEFGDLCFQQLLGTAMGTSSAVMWATFYYGYHEVHNLLPRFGHCLLYFKRYIDDIFGIWIGSDREWNEFKDSLTFGVLTWDIAEQQLSSSVDFLDMTLSIENGRIVSKTFQKKMNLYLYLPPASAHPVGCIKGMIFGLIRRYYAQNTYQRDFVHYVRLLYRRLLARGWKSDFIRPLISAACQRSKHLASLPPRSPTEPSIIDDEVHRLFIHLVYHPDDLPRRRIQELYEQHCGDLFRSELNLNRPTIAYSRPKNIGDFATRARLFTAPSDNASIIMGEYRDGLSPP